MPNQEETALIADAVTAMRPEWPVGAVADYLEEHHGKIPYDILAAAAVFVAAQPMASDLSWLEHDGYWWIKPPAGIPGRDPETQPITRKRDEKWWANFNLAQAQRAQKFGYPKLEAEES